MSIETEYEAAKKSNDLWKFITRHGCRNFSKTTGEKIPDYVQKDQEFIKYSAIYNALQLTLHGDFNALLKHGDGQGNYSEENGVRLNPEINHHLTQYTKINSINLQQRYKLFNHSNSNYIQFKDKKTASNNEWETAFILLNSELYKDKIKKFQPFKIRKKDHNNAEIELLIQHSFIYMDGKLYAMEEEIGSGSQGKVRKITSINKKYYVAKIEIYNDETKDELDAEIAALKLLGMYIGSFELNYNGKKFIDGMKRYLLMTYVTGCTVDNYLKRSGLTDFEKIKVCQYITLALLTEVSPFHIMQLAE